MTQPARQWNPEVVEETDQPASESHLAVSGLMLALKALSQRAVIALESCFALFVFAGVWSLWYLTPDPTGNQVTSLTIFAAFGLIAIGLVMFRRKR
jgi:LPXTG-motif cell wall-anchored protein